MLKITSVGMGKGTNLSSLFYNKQFHKALRGVNIYVITNDGNVISQNYDTYEFNYTNVIVDYIKHHCSNDENKYLIFVVEDEASTNLKTVILKNSLPQLNLQKIMGLIFRSSYYFMFDISSQKLISEEISNYSNLTATFRHDGQLLNKKKYHIVCLTSTFHVFKEYTDSFKNWFNADYCVTNDLLTYQYLDHPDEIYLFCQSIDVNLMSKKFNKLVINTEQLTRSIWSQVINNHFRNNITVLDYGPENIEIMQQINPNPQPTGSHFYLPYLYEESEISQLRNYYTKSTKLYDVAYCGALSDRRKNILDKLRELGLGVLNVEGFGKHRDILIASCKVLINIHYAADYDVYESIRCDRWAFASMPVISEDSINSDSLDVNKHNLIFFSSYDELPQFTVDFIRNFKQPTQMAIDSVRNERAVIMEEILNKV